MWGLAQLFPGSPFGSRSQGRREEVTSERGRHHARLHFPGCRGVTVKHRVWRRLQLTWNGSCVESHPFPFSKALLAHVPALIGGSAGFTECHELDLISLEFQEALPSHLVVLAACHTVDLISSPLLGLHSIVGAGFELGCTGSSPVSLGWKIISLKFACRLQGEPNTLPCEPTLLGLGEVIHTWFFLLPSLTFVKVSNYKARTSLRLSSCSRVSPLSHP